MNEANHQDIQALAKGGRTNFLGFLLRLLGTAPFLFIAGRLYGVEALGVYASAVLIAELAAQLCALGQRRGLAQRLAAEAGIDMPIVSAVDALLRGAAPARQVVAELLARPLKAERAAR